ncbi:MAG: hypothetical protein HY548_00175 [Elusimicrobia bacterium]|nr:hypothetical protein [Elusimicrobiota bacterium]
MKYKFQDAQPVDIVLFSFFGQKNQNIRTEKKYKKVTLFNRIRKLVIPK